MNVHSFRRSHHRLDLRCTPRGNKSRGSATIPSVRTTAINESGIYCSDRTESCATLARWPAQSELQSKCRLRQAARLRVIPVAQRHAPRTQRHTDPNFPSAPGDRIRHYSVKSNTSEHQRQPRKECRKFRQCDLVRRTVIHQTAECVGQCDWQLRISRLDLASWCSLPHESGALHLGLDHDLKRIGHLLKSHI